MENKRVLGIDIVRFVAFLFVPCVHFFLNNGFYTYPVQGKRMFIMLNMRWLFFTCVPLFMLLTGYLNGKRKINKDHYKSIIPILISYVFICVITIIFKITYLGEKQSIIQWIMTIFNYSASNYAWYIEMYIGLFLIIPFLNLLYNNLKTKGHKSLLLGVLLFSTALPPVFNLKSGLKLIPDYWIDMYPITYYFLGRYIKEYPIKIKKWICAIVILAICFIEAVITYKCCYGVHFNWGCLGGYNALPTLIVTLFIFLLFYDMDIKNKVLAFFIQDIAMLSLDMYLISYIFDTILYPPVLEKTESVINTLPYFFIIVPLVIIFSYIVAFIKRIIFETIKNRRFTIM